MRGGFLTNTLMIISVVRNYALMFQAAILILFFLEVANLNNCTCKGPSDLSLFFMKSLVKSTCLLLPLLYEECSTEKYQLSNYSGNIYLCACGLLFQLSAA
jgi:hypothetical protein